MTDLAAAPEKILAQKLGCSIGDSALWRQALCHSSYAHENPEEFPQSNERMEYLGDAVLELVVSDLLFHRFPDAREGEMSPARASMVNESSLAKAARSLDLGSLLLLGRGEVMAKGAEKSSLLADALEAVIAAVYLDCGMEEAKRVILYLIGGRADNAINHTRQKDFKTRIQEKVQQDGKNPPRYRLAGESGPDHHKTFEVALEIEGREVCRGHGGSKKEAEQKAAAKALIKLYGRK